MYTATMVYEFKEDQFDRACELWNEHVLTRAAKQPGLVRMQFLTAAPTAMAIGTWEDSSSAQAFMQTGVFKTLMEILEPLLAEQPKPRIWDLKYFTEST